MQRSLRERRERADVLDLVAEELDAERLASGAREDVDEPSADGDLTALLDPVDPLVPGERERLDELVDGDLLAGAEPKRLRPLALRRQPFGERARRGCDETAGRQHVERPGALADEMRGRLESRADADTAARQQRDGRRIDEPADGFRGVARVLVLRQHCEQGLAAGLVQRGEDEWERRLRDARGRRELVEERTKRLALGELGDEDMEWCRGSVHAFGGNRVPRLHRSPVLQTRRRAVRSGAEALRHARPNLPQGHSRVPTRTVARKSSHVAHGFEPTSCRCCCDWSPCSTTCARAES